MKTETQQSSPFISSFWDFSCWCPLISTRLELPWPLSSVSCGACKFHLGSIPGQSPTFWKSPLHTKKSHSFMCGLLRNSWGESNSAGYHPVSSVFWNLGGSLQESLILTSQNHKKSAIWAMQSSAAIWGLEPDPLEPQVQNSLCIWKTWFLGNLLL